MPPIVIITSIINREELKRQGNRSRGVEDPEIQEKIRNVVTKLIS